MLTKLIVPVEPLIYQPVSLLKIKMEGNKTKIKLKPLTPCDRGCMNLTLTKHLLKKRKQEPPKLARVT
jgi:hypothetical protein